MPRISHQGHRAQDGEELVQGVEPWTAGWRPAMLPLHHTSLVPRGGLEPPRFRLTVERTTIVLPGKKNMLFFLKFLWAGQHGPPELRHGAERHSYDAGPVQPIRHHNHPQGLLKGLEPPTIWIEASRSCPLSYSSKKTVLTKGLEPSAFSFAEKRSILLSYASMWTGLTYLPFLCFYAQRRGFTTSVYPQTSHHG